jgi:hypothetical protein
MADPWGSPYVIAPASSTCYSVGSDRSDNSGDEIKMAFRPPLAISKAYWEDSNKNVRVDTGDKLIVKFTRPIRKDAGDGPQLTIGDDDFIYSNGAPANDYSAIDYYDYDMTIRITFDFGAATPFKPGLDTLEVKDGNTIVDGEGTPCKTDQQVAIKPYQ